jgi:hypothetical protein
MLLLKQCHDIVKLSILEYIEFSLLLNKTENVLEIKIIEKKLDILKKIIDSTSLYILNYE